MLRNLFVGNNQSPFHRISFPLNLHTLSEKRFLLASSLAIFITPIAALAFWYYSFAMSLGAIAPTAAIQDDTTTMFAAQIETNAAANTDVTPGASIETTVTNQLDATNSSQTKVEVNGQSLPVPTNGSTRHVLENDNGQTTVDITVNSDTTGTSDIHSSTNINLHSSSRSTTDIHTESSSY